MKILTDKMEIGCWYRKELDGAVSSNGKQYSISLKKGNINKLFVFFLGGGLSWNAMTAANPITIGALMRQKEAFYIPHVYNLQLKSMNIGLLDNKDARNPFADWHMLVLPYASADFHLGNKDYPYQDNKGNPRILHHQGAKNVQKALQVLKEMFPETPDHLVIAGVSAGGFGCVAHAPSVQALYPECKKTIVFADGSYLNASHWSDVAKNVWNVSAHLAPFIKSSDIMSDLFHYASAQMPEDTIFLHANTVWDAMLVKFMNKMNNGIFAIDEQALMTFHQQLICDTKKLKKELPAYFYYLTDYGKKKNGTTFHNFAGSAKLIYGKLQDETSIVDWLNKAISGAPLDIGTQFTV